MKIKALFLLLVMTTVGQAAEIVPVAAPEPALSMLSADQVFRLLAYAIGGSLGALGLLLGLDKVIIMLFRLGDGDAFRRYSSESIARILPIVIEGITVILVVLTVIILAVLRIISAEGSLGILGSIVGYVLGKSSRKASGSPNGEA